MLKLNRLSSRTKILMISAGVLLLAALGCDLNAGSLLPTEGPTQSPTSQASPTPVSTILPVVTQGATATGVQAVTPAGYAVVLVTEDDVLNVRSGPGASNPIVGEIGYDTGRGAGPLIAVIGDGQVVDGDLWVPIQIRSLQGWVNRTYLTEAVYGPDFCANVQVTDIISELTAAVGADDSDQLAALVHPERGLRIRYNWWNTDVRFSRDEVAQLFTDSTSRDWGYYDGSGDPIKGSAAEIAVPLLKRDLLDADLQTGCNEIVAGSTAGYVIIPPKYGGLNYISLHRPPIDQGLNLFDWGTWVVGIEYWEGQPYLVYLVHYEWEI